MVAMTLTKKSKKRFAWRISGDHEPYERTRKHVTPKCNLKDEVLDAHSPLDALVIYCDLHGWRVERADRTEGQPVPMEATIRSGDKQERVNVVVTAVNVTPHTNRDGTMWHGIYRIALTT